MPKIKKIYLGQKQVRPELYKYSYNFIGKNMTQIANDGWQGTAGWNIDSDGIWNNNPSSPMYIQPTGLTSALATAKKITLTIGLYVTKGSGTRDIVIALANNTSLSSWIGLYCPGNADNYPNTFGNMFNYSYTGATTFTFIYDLVNKTVTATSTDGNTISPNTFTLTDANISTIRTFSYIGVQQNGTASKGRSIGIKIE